MIAVIRIRGRVNTSQKVEDTLKMLRLKHVNSCVVIPASPSNMGMVEKCKDWVAYGNVSQETLSDMLKKRGRKAGDKRLDDESVKNLGFKGFEDFAKSLMEGKTNLKKLDGLSPVFKLSPPSKGHDSIKESLPNGSLGNWGDKINDLLSKMI